MKNKKNRKIGNRPKNKRIQRKEKELKAGRKALILFFALVTSPLWLYVGIIREIILPAFGEKSKAVLTEIRKPGVWSRYHYNEPDFYYTFYINNKLYKANSGLQPNDSSYYLGDTIDIIYLRPFPFISARTSPKEKIK